MIINQHKIKNYNRKQNYKKATVHQISKKTYHVTLYTFNRKYQQTTYNETMTLSKRPKTNNKRQKKNTSPLSNGNDVRPKYEYYPNELYRLITKEEQKQYFNTQAVGTPLLKDNQQKLLSKNSSFMNF